MVDTLNIKTLNKQFQNNFFRFCFELLIDLWIGELMTTDHSRLWKVGLQTIFCFTLRLPKWLFMGTFLDRAVFHVRNRGTESWVTNCQSFHKLTCKPVAFAFPRPCYVVMFTPWPQSGSHCASCCAHQSPHTKLELPVHLSLQSQRCIWHMDVCSHDDHTILYSSV